MVQEFFHQQYVYTPESTNMLNPPKMGIVWGGSTFPTFSFKGYVFSGEPAVFFPGGGGGNSDILLPGMQ